MVFSLRELGADFGDDVGLALKFTEVGVGRVKDQEGASHSY